MFGNFHQLLGLHFSGWPAPPTPAIAPRPDGARPHLPFRLPQPPRDHARRYGAVQSAGGRKRRRENQRTGSDIAVRARPRPAPRTTGRNGGQRWAGRILRGCVADRTGGRARASGHSGRSGAPRPAAGAGQRRGSERGLAGRMAGDFVADPGNGPPVCRQCRCAATLYGPAYGGARRQPCAQRRPLRKRTA